MNCWIYQDLSNGNGRKPTYVWLAPNRKVARKFKRFHDKIPYASRLGPLVQGESLDYYEWGFIAMVRGCIYLGLR